MSFSSILILQDIPLSCLAGPVLDVFSTSQSTESWFAEYLLGNTNESESDGNGTTETSKSQAPWWARGCEQSDLGILLRVDDHAIITRSGLEVREILLYAGISGRRKEAEETLLTPPGSSSPTRLPENPVNIEKNIPRTVRIYARLLYSGFPWICDGDTPPPSTGSNETVEAQFLAPPNGESVVTSHVEQTTTKRRKVDALFEEAARENKRSRKRGGGNVAHVMAKGDHPSPALFPHGLKEMTLADNEYSSAVNSQPGVDAPTVKKTLGLSRSKSVSSLRDFGESRPSSRHSNPAINDIQKRSSLHRVSSMTDQDGASSSTVEAMSTVETQNRNALTRVVMAGLRLYGFQPKKKPLTNLPNQPSLSTDNDEEYKLLYHQTFKAAAFVFRRQIAVDCLGQPALREVVDKLLGMFCVDPLNEAQVSESFTQATVNVAEENPALGELIDNHEEANCLDKNLTLRKSGSSS